VIVFAQGDTGRRQRADLGAAERCRNPGAERPSTNLEGWSNVDDGIVIDVSEMKSATIHLASNNRDRRRRAQPAGSRNRTRQGRLRGADRHRRTVGLVGATLGGGFGLLTRKLRHGVGQPDRGRGWWWRRMTVGGGDHPSTSRTTQDLLWRFAARQREISASSLH